MLPGSLSPSCSYLTEDGFAAWIFRLATSHPKSFPRAVATRGSSFSRRPPPVRPCRGRWHFYFYFYLFFFPFPSGLPTAPGAAARIALTSPQPARGAGPPPQP